MSTVTIRLPDDKHARLRQLAKHRNLSVNKLMASANKGLALLDKLDAAFAR
jgi:predicted transcriptional regulator